MATAALQEPQFARLLESYVLAFVDLRRARLANALERLRAEDDGRVDDLVVVAGVLGRSDEVATTWATALQTKSDDDVQDMLQAYVGSIVLCMRAQEQLAVPCLQRLSRLGEIRNWWGDGGDVLLAGARRYAAGDVRDAVALWRPLVGGPSVDIARVLPTEAFERAGEPALAARLDARKMQIAFIAGVSDAAPREAKRALAAGDKARARELASQVVTAQEVADAVVPAVAEMRGVLKALER